MDKITTENQNKERVLKSLAVVGFVGLLVIIAWLGIQLISFMPSAFTSLASLADSVYNYKPVEIVVVSNKSIANSGEAFSVTWNKSTVQGDYIFNYKCAEGVTVVIRDAKGTISTVECEKDFSLGNVNSLDLSINSENNRFTDIAYTISFVRKGATDSESAKDNVITVVNPAISNEEPAPIATTTPAVSPTPVPVETPVVIKPTPTPSKPVVTPSKPVLTTTQKPVYAIPVSNPNGYTDLSVRSIGVGTIDSNNRFSLVGTMDNDYKGAIQFEIKNFGTKTSNAFTYTATLPNGSVYNSGDQLALKPNERAVITLGFDTTNLMGVKMFNVKINSTSDNNSKNDTFLSAVSIRD